MAVVRVLGFFEVAATNRSAAKRLKQQAISKTEIIEGSQKASLGTVLISTFGLFLLAMMLNDLGIDKLFDKLSQQAGAREPQAESHIAKSIAQMEVLE